jgi:hypothetical protein
MRTETIIVAALFLAGWQKAPAVSQEKTLSFSCETFGARISESDLKARFGSANVTTGLVPWGGAEGDFNEGTILFADRPEARLEIYWKNRAEKRDPNWINVRGTKSLWRSPGGVMLGTDLKTVERLNGRPFRLLGFGTDLSGGLYSWSGGLLERHNIGGCRMGFRFVPPNAYTSQPELQALSRQVIGERVYSSGHPAMQALNPRVEEAVIMYNVWQ